MPERLTTEEHIKSLRPLIDYGIQLGYILDMARQSSELKRLNVDNVLADLHNRFFHALEDYSESLRIPDNE